MKRTMCIEELGPAPALTYLNCPRCSDLGYERLETYSHCVNCLFFHDRFEDSISLSSVVEAERLLRDSAQPSNVYQFRATTDEHANPASRKKAVNQ